MSKRSYSKIIGASFGCLALATNLIGCGGPAGGGEDTDRRGDGVVVTKKFHVTAKSFIDYVEPQLAPLLGDQTKFNLLLLATNAQFNEDPSVDEGSGHFRLFGSFDLYGACNGDVMEPSNFWYGNAYSAAGYEGDLQGEIDSLQIGAHAVFDGSGNHIGYNVDYVLSGRPHIAAEPVFQAIRVRTNRTIFQHSRIELRCSGGTPVATPSAQGSYFPSHRVWVEDDNGDSAETTTYQRKMAELWALPSTPIVGGSCSCDNAQCVCDGVDSGGGIDGSGCDCLGTDLDGNEVSTTECGRTVCAQDYQVWSCTNNNFQPTGEVCGGGPPPPPVGCDCAGTDLDGNEVSTTECGKTVCAQDYQVWACTADNFQPTGEACGGGDQGGGDQGGGDTGCDCVGTNQEGGDASTNVCGATVCSEDYQIWLCTSSGYQPTGTGC